jgi:NADP-dependent 3-hydroxy acid dehydrogenase YdfG
LHQLEKRDYYPNLLIQPADVATVVTQALALPRSVELTDLSMRPLAPPVSKT